MCDFGWRYDAQHFRPPIRLPTRATIQNTETGHLNIQYERIYAIPVTVATGLMFIYFWINYSAMQAHAFPLTSK